MAAAIVAALAATTACRSPEPARLGPTLLVVLVVDQMRQDYIDRLEPHWTNGLKRLTSGGARFDETFYPYLQTVTCAGHATIATGTFPSTHGIIMNAWWRGTRNAACTDDPTVAAVPYGPDADTIGHSARELAVPTLGDRVRERWPGARVVTLSVKARSAIMLAGRSGLVTWRDDRHVWATSTAFSSEPDPDVQAFVLAHPVAALRDRVWTPLRDAGAYTGDDDGPGEAPPRGWTATFPHPLAGEPGSPPARFDTLWRTSPDADEYLGAMAAHLVRQLKLGQGPGVDLIGVGFSALDAIGHAFGPDSHEVQDALLRLDVTIGTLLDTLDREVGADRYVVALSSDHGVSPIPERRQRQGQDGGRLVLSELARVADEALVPGLGPGPHVARVEGPQLYLADTARTRVAADPDLLKPAIDALSTVPGVWRVFSSHGLERDRGSEDPVVRAAALSYFPGRSGQLVIVPRPHYLMGSAATRGATHGTLHAYDQHVPLVFYGRGIRPGRFARPATPADLAPTLAAAAGVPMPSVDGRALSEALAPF
jgi:predicted AlkP superfamily pyrophosphatase or phosphodiesterase